MDTALFSAALTFALKFGPTIYNQIRDLVGDSIPTYADLKKENERLRIALEEAEKT